MKKISPRWVLGSFILLLPFTASCGSQTSSPPVSHNSANGNKPVPKIQYPWKSHTHSSVLPGDVLIADSLNNRILIVTPGKRVVWQFPSAHHPSNRPFKVPDDAFFGPGYNQHYKEIITNEESNGTIAVINILQKKVVWEYGKPGVQGSLPGELNYPDDAILHNNGTVTVADIRNQRILFINRATKQIMKQYGQTGLYNPNPPYSYGSPNGDFPAPHGGMLVTEISGSHIILLNKHGQVVWQHVLPMPYPSDANFTPHGNIIVASYANPGMILKVSPSGQVLWKYYVTSGPGKLNMPSLAFELSNGYIMVNDDYNDRVIVINPTTKKIVWQYGHTGVPGSSPGYLNRPDGCNFLPIGKIPGH